MSRLAPGRRQSALVTPAAHCSSVKTGAFTLIELLVVIAVIAILASLILPSLSVSKAKAYRVQCVNNLHQLSITWEMYSGDNAGLLVPNGYGTLSSLGGTKLWVQGTTHKVVGDEPLAFTRVEYLMDPERAAFADYLKTAAVYKCPADHSMYGDQPKIRSYALNSYMNWTKPDDGGDFLMGANYVNFRKISEVSAAGSSDRLLFMDAAPNWLCHSAFGIAMTTLYYQFPSIEHGRVGVLSFADGHVTTHRWEDSYTFQMARATFVTHINFAFSSYEDLNWLREHATVRR